jgi:purine-binding chemotaxis protein CheW
VSELHVLFGVGDATYALPASMVAQMESFTGATPVPGAPAHVLGLVQVRGSVVPVIDLRVRFGLPGVERGLDARMVVVERDGRRVALLADAAREVVRIEPSSFVAPPDEITAQSARFVKAVAQIGRRLVLLIDCDRVIGEEEKHV